MAFLQAGEVGASLYYSTCLVNKGNSYKWCNLISYLSRVHDLETRDHDIVSRGKDLAIDKTEILLT
jgi:hypothetical protein